MAVNRNHNGAFSLVETPKIREAEPGYVRWSPERTAKEIEHLRAEMFTAAENLEFERAAELRDRIRELESHELRVR